MKPTLALTDYNTLRSLLRHSAPFRSDKEVTMLQEELNKATVIDDRQVSEEIVRLNSHVKIRDEKSGKTSMFQIVLPQNANLKERKVSVLAPMSIALLGFKEGDSFDWEMPGGLKRILIVSVRNYEPDLAA